MPDRKKPLVIVTRKLPDVIETRMMELFEPRLNLDDAPPDQQQLAQAVKEAEVLVPTVTDRVDARVLAQAGPQLRLIASFGTGVDHIDPQDRAPARHHRDQHAGGADRGHRRHDHGPDPVGAAPPGRGRAA